MGLHDLLGDSFTLSFVDDARTSQKTQLCASTTRYGDSFTLSYLDDVHTSKKTYVRATAA
jgi:hypothetical protein